MANSVKILKESADPNEIHSRNLTTDCYYVRRTNGQTDIARAGKMVDVFDFYYDRGICLERIYHAGGRLNPKFREPNL